MIIVEGPDGAGKTTLIAQIAGYLGWPVAERVVSKEAKAMTDLVKWVEENLQQGFQQRIFDRHRLISGPIYSSILKGHPDDGYEDFEWVSHMQFKMMYEVEPIIIWCLPPLDVVMHNWTFGGDIQPAEFTPEKVRQIYWLYHHRATLEPSPITYDYTTDDTKMIFDFIDEELENRDAD